MAVKLDLERFWAENAASAGKAFRTDKPRCPIGLPVDDHWLMDEMGISEASVRYFREDAFRLEQNRLCNDRCQAAIGIRPFGEKPGARPPLRIEEVFGCRFEVLPNTTPWLEPGVKDIESLRELMDRIEELDDAGFERLLFSNGAEKPTSDQSAAPRAYSRWSRGPATIATSVMGTTDTLYAMVDHPQDMERFFDLLADTLIRYHRTLSRLEGSIPRGFCWLDDNCALLSPEMYQQFCFPVMDKVFKAFAPEPDQYRFQHSDSAMSHLLPILSRLNFHGVNFGPTIPVQQIRAAMPRAEIQGQVAPMTLRNGSPEQIEQEVKRDFEGVGLDGGLLITTAGSISAGTSLENIRVFMSAVDRFARYDR